MQDWVLVDTLIWASFFSKPASLEKRALDKLIDADRVALVGPVVAEVLMGFRRKDQADWVASRLRLVHQPDITWDDWRMAAQIGRRLAALGRSVPVTDLVIMAVAMRNDIAVYTTDPHFDLLPQLKRHHPST